MDAAPTVFYQQLISRKLEPHNALQLRFLLKSCSDTKRDDFLFVPWHPEWIKILNLFGTTVRTAIRAMENLGPWIVSIEFVCGSVRVNIRPGVQWDLMFIHEETKSMLRSALPFLQRNLIDIRQPLVSVSFINTRRSRDVVQVIYLPKEKLSWETLLSSYQERMKLCVIGNNDFAVRACM